MTPEMHAHEKWRFSERCRLCRRIRDLREREDQEQQDELRLHAEEHAEQIGMSRLLPPSPPYIV